MNGLLESYLPLLLGGSLAALGVGLAMWGLSQARAAQAILPSPIAAARVRKVQTGMDGELNDVIAILRAHLSASGHYKHSLMEAQTSLPHLSTTDDIRSTIQSLVAENEIMRAKSEELDQRLEQARDQIQSLRADLAEAEENSLKDPVTGLVNRRSFNQGLRRSIAEAQEKHGRLCLIMCDLDHFKRINDSFGHLVGDDVLKRFSELLASSLDKHDLPARFGGEEFAVILPGSTLGRAQAVAEILRLTLEGKRWSTAQGDRRIGQVTASFGVAEMQPGDDPERLVQRADQALYQAKCDGRNRVCTAVGTRTSTQGLPTHAFAS